MKIKTAIHHVKQIDSSLVVSIMTVTDMCCNETRKAAENTEIYTVTDGEGVERCKFCNGIVTVEINTVPRRHPHVHDVIKQIEEASDTAGLLHSSFDKP